MGLRARRERSRFKESPGRKRLGVGLWDLAFWVSGFGFQVMGSEFRISGFGPWVPGSGFRVPDSSSWVPGSGFRAACSGFRASGDFRFLVSVLPLYGAGDGASLAREVEGEVGFRVSGFGFQVSDFMFGFTPDFFRVSGSTLTRFSEIGVRVSGVPFHGAKNGACLAREVT